MDWIEKLKEDLHGAIVGLIIGVGSMAVWVVRTVLTDRARVNALERGMENMKSDIDQSLGDLKSDVRQITGHLIGKDK